MADKRLLRDPTPEEIAEHIRIRDDIKAGWSEEERAKRSVYDGRVRYEPVRIYATPDLAAYRE